MRRLPGLIVLVLALAIPAVGATAAPSAPQTAHAAKLKNCKTPFRESRTAHRIQATGLSCPVAVKVAMRVATTAPRGCVKFSKSNHVKLVRPCVRLGYRCTSTPIVNGYGLEAVCRRGGKTIGFQY